MVRLYGGGRYRETGTRDLNAAVASASCVCGSCGWYNGRESARARTTVDTFLYFDFPHPRGCGEASIGGARGAVPVAWEVGSSLDITMSNSYV